MTDNVSPRAHADLALAVYLEPHAEGRRVLLLGEAEGVLADRFDRLATYLEIIDPGAREPSRGEVPELPFDDGSFDLVLVCDAAALPEPQVAALRELQRVLSRTGLLAVVQPTGQKRRRRGGPPEVALERLLSDCFRHVRVLAQAPVSLYALGELRRERGGEFSIDSSLVRDSEPQPERLLGLASQAALAAEPRLWVELPAPPAALEQDERAQVGLVEELRRAEDEAREALHRESDLLRELEVERKARAEAEHVAERAALFERKLLAAEADYDDAVARVRYFEGTIGEREAAAAHDRERREHVERELAAAKREFSTAGERLRQLEAERDGALSELELASSELRDLEQRLAEQGKVALELERDKKRHEATARDLLEELRRLESDRTSSVEHDARIAELEAERERAVQRALESEVAREAAQMRVDELRAELLATEQRAVDAPPRERSAPEAAAADDGDARQARVAELEAQTSRLRGECRGLRFRLNDAELALAAIVSPSDQLVRATRELEDLRLRFAHSEAGLHALRDIQGRKELGRAAEAVAPRQRHGELERTRELESQLAAADQRLQELTRELEEADRFAEVHAEDAERLSGVEAELASARERLEDLEQELRASDDELRVARLDLTTAQRELQESRAAQQRSASDAAAKLELVERHEAERDDALAALAEARSILSQLAGRVGADENDPPSIVQAIMARDDSRSTESARLMHELRDELSRRDQRIQQLEERISERREPELPAQSTDSNEF